MPRHREKSPVFGIALALLLACALPGREAQPQPIPIRDSDLPLTIGEPGSYIAVEHLSHNQRNTHAININSHYVTINLNGFTLKGPGKNKGHEGCGIFAIGRDTPLKNITILNGVVAHFRDSGISLSNATCSKIVGMMSQSNGANGFVLGQNSQLGFCSAANNVNTGIFALEGAQIGNCMATDNGNGIFVAAESKIGNCTAMGNNIGIAALDSASIENCVAAENRMFGIAAGHSCYLLGNICIANTNSDPALSASGLVLSGQYSYMARCFMGRNDIGLYIPADGIESLPVEGNVIVKNTSCGNTTDLLALAIDQNSVGEANSNPDLVGARGNMYTFEP